MAPGGARRIGFVVNPVAGMGGRVALKGTDGAALEEAIARGAAPRAPGRAAEFAGAVAKAKVSALWLTCGGPMGEKVLAAAGLPHEVVSRPRDAVTSASDTVAATAELRARGVELIVFVGGDGTAKDIFEVIGNSLTMLGVPSGVKMHSGVFALTPWAAAQLVLAFCEGTTRTKEGEVLDADEESIRRGVIEVSLKGIAKTLALEGLTQVAKIEYRGEVEEVSKRGIADNLIERMDDQTLYLFGPGSTTGAVMESVGLTHTLLGVDLVRARRMVKADATDADIKEAIAQQGGPVEIIVGVIGAQGFVFGRGNLQFSPEVIRAVGKKNITILAAEEKIEGLTELLVDTGDAALDRELAGHWRVLCGYRWNVFLPMRAPSGPT